jgi:hypothetical protein
MPRIQPASTIDFVGGMNSPGRRIAAHPSNIGLANFRCGPDGEGGAAGRPLR